MSKPDAPRQADPGRPARTRVEAFLGNCRPMPAVPAVLALLIGVIVPVAANDPAAAPDGGPVWALYLIPVGILVSAGLAIAAGFCSVFPHLAWLFITWWLFNQPGAEALPAFHRGVFIAGMVLVAIMFYVQVWRARTGKFVPTFKKGDS